MKEFFEKNFFSFKNKIFLKIKESIKKGYCRAIRVNTIKIKTTELKERLEKKGFILKQISWFKDAFFVEGNKSLGKTIEHFLGYFFVQDASSLLPPLVLDPKPGEIILDLCAAPGAKTTQMAQMMKNRGIIFANEPKIKRASILKGNLQRCGVVNTIVTNFDGRLFWKTNLKFKKILIDAPCSGSGTFISNPSIFSQLKEGLIKKLSHLQKTILASALKCLDKDGIIVYSTCSLDPRENEEIIDWAIQEFKLKIQDIKIEGINLHPGILEYDSKKFSPEILKCKRIYPFDYQTEGFFVCKLSF